MGQCRPCLGKGLGEFLFKHRIEQRKPDRKVVAFDVARSGVNLHRVAVVTPLQQKRVAPEQRDLCLVRGPVGHMGGKDRPKHGMGADAGIELRHDCLDLVHSDRNAWRDGQTTKIQTKIRLSTR